MIHSDTKPIDHAAHGRLAAGAKSPEGLARSAQNATKHGLSARNFCLLPNEDPELFAQHQANLLATFAPTNPMELFLVEKMIEAQWLINRLTEIENRTLGLEIRLQRHKRSAQGPGPADFETREAALAFFAIQELEARNKTFANLARYRATHERSYYRAWNALAKLRGGHKALTALSWPESGTESGTETRLGMPSQFVDVPSPDTAPDPQPTPDPQPATDLQNEAPTAKPNNEFCKTKPPTPAPSLAPSDPPPASPHQEQGEQEQPENEEPHPTPITS